MSWPAAAMEAAWRATKTPSPGERPVGNQVVTTVTRMMSLPEPVQGGSAGQVAGEGLNHPVSGVAVTVGVGLGLGGLGRPWA